MTPMKSPARVKFFLSTLVGGSHVQMKLLNLLRVQHLGGSLRQQLIIWIT